MKKYSSLLPYIPLIIWAMLIFFMSHMPGEASGNFSKKVLAFLLTIGLDLTKWLGEDAHLFIRKSAHMTEYAILYFLGMVPQKLRNIPLLFFLFCFLFACLDELHQYFIPQRVAAVEDVLIDTLGVLLAFGLWQLLLKLKPGSLEKAN